MQRGDLYMVRKPGQTDPRRQRVFVVVSRQALIDSNFSTVICAPVYSKHDGLSTQVSAGIVEGLKHKSSVHCDELVGMQKSKLTRFVGRLYGEKLLELEHALKVALELDRTQAYVFRLQ